MKYSNSILKKVLRFRRQIRLKYALKNVKLFNGMKILDIGCGPDGRSFSDFIKPDYRIIGADILPVERVKHQHPNFIYINISGADLEFEDNYFDLVVTIGMLEHITDPAIFEKITNNIKRLSEQHIVIVPYKYAWIEPHWGIPLFPIIRPMIQNYLVKTFNICNHRQSIKNDINFIKKHYVWYSNSEYSKIFPSSRIKLLPFYDTIGIIKSRKDS